MNDHDSASPQRVSLPQAITVEVAYALPARQSIICLSVSLGTTAEQAITQSGILKQFQDIDLTQNKIGIFGKICKLDTVLQHKDRVEIYRPLLLNPKDMRRQRVAADKAAQSAASKATDNA